VGIKSYAGNVIWTQCIRALALQSTHYLLPPMHQNCTNCGLQFQITDDDIKYYTETRVSHPTHCPNCRTQRRLANRNERCLYQDKCDMCEKNIVSLYSPDKDIKTYCYDCYLSDKWDPMSYGRDFDFTRPFFEQFYELKKDIPHMNIYQLFNENCDYSNYTGYCRNCYMCFGPYKSEDCMYGSPYESKNCVDTYVSYGLELCYECINCEKLYGCIECQECVGSSGLFFCYDCRSCSDCIGCVGLRNKKFHIWNKPYSQEEYERIKSSLNLGNRTAYDTLKNQFEKFKKQFPRIYAKNPKSENVSGNFIVESKNCENCFDAKSSQDCKDCAQITYAENCRDCNYEEEITLCYENIGYAFNNSIKFNNTSGHSHEVYYTEFCTNCQYCFGCAELRKKQFCILNKQYTESQYKELLPRIIEHMKQAGLPAGQAGEWGEFFPIKYSLFGYNETVAQDYFPITEKIAQEKGWGWTPENKKALIPQTCVVADDIKDIPDSVTTETLACEITGKNYKIIPQELSFYRKTNLPIPKRCPDQRHLDRLAKCAPRKLWDRTCAKCGAEIKTPYSPDRQETVYCEKCYLEAIY